MPKDFYLTIFNRISERHIGIQKATFCHKTRFGISFDTSSIETEKEYR
ncbi:hypothetical protein HMPREF1146_0368 [Prevotella sp. MSX73]|nr:hypothetical protein HMPREF1146_0368 [Prevotella sp. MSX73]